MKNIFNHVEVPKVPTNRFDMSHGVKMSGDMGELLPAFTAECYPGDRWYIKPEVLARFAPLVSPVMHHITIDYHFFFTPNRKLWADWEDFITGVEEVETPKLQAMDSLVVGALGDYLGYVPNAPHPTFQASCLPVAAYALIYDEYYRAQDLQAKYFEPLISGNNSWCTTLYRGFPLKRAWNHDYFTACLPFAQKGDPVTLPLLNNSTANVTLADTTNQPIIRENNAAGNPLSGNMLAGVTGDLTVFDGVANIQAQFDPNETLVVDINGEAVDITTVRTAFAIQAFLERDARSGTRYIETVEGHFGVYSSDKRLDRPEYLGGLKMNMVISEVLATAETVSGTTVTNPVGQMAGHGLSVGGGNTIQYFVEEHGWINGIISVRPRTAYQQGLHKSLLRNDRLDYMWPQFANIGEQPVYMTEIYMDAPGDELGEVFGYIPRYSELRFMNSRVAGDMRSTLNFWHLGRIFNEKPLLNSNFIECAPDKRIFAAPSEDGIYFHIVNNAWVDRKLSKFGTPSI